MSGAKSHAAVGFQPHVMISIGSSACFSFPDRLGDFPVPLLFSSTLLPHSLLELELLPDPLLDTEGGFPESGFPPPPPKIKFPPDGGVFATVSRVDAFFPLRGLFPGVGDVTEVAAVNM